MMVTIPPSPVVSPPQTTRSVLMPPLQEGKLSPTPKRVCTFEQFPTHRMPARRGLGRSLSAVELHLLSSPSRRGGSYADLQHLGQVCIILTMLGPLIPSALSTTGPWENLSAV